MASSTCSFHVGESFSSYTALESKIKSYEKSRSVQLTHRDSRTLDGARKRTPKHVQGAKQELVYFSMHLTCVFGGKKYKMRGTGERNHSRLVELTSTC